MKSRRSRYACVFACSLLSLAPALALAVAPSPRQSLNALNRCASAQDAPACREEITASSIDLYDRFVSYGLMRCLPGKATYVSEQRAARHTVVRARTEENIVRLSFVEEEGAWKLDVPDTLKRGLGNNWKQQVNATEQLYLLMKRNMGTQLDCAMIRNLVKPATEPAKQKPIR